MSNLVVIGVGSNIDPLKYIVEARDEIRKNHLLLKVSVFRETEPIGEQAQANFINGAFLVQTEYEQNDLKMWLRSLEDRLDRSRDLDQYGPRTIDLDIVIWNEEVLDNDLYKRKYLNQSVLDLMPDFNIGKKI